MATRGASLRVSSCCRCKSLHRTLHGKCLRLRINTTDLYYAARFCIAGAWHGATNGHSELQQCGGKNPSQARPVDGNGEECIGIPALPNLGLVALGCGNQSGVNTMALALAGLVLLAMAAYVYGESTVKKAISALLLIAAVALAIPQSDGTQSASGSRSLAEGQIAWSASTLASYRETGKPIFVDVTADWCITCLANEAAVLFHPKLKAHS